MIVSNRFLVGMMLAASTLFSSPSWALFEDDGARVAINKILARLKDVEDRLMQLESTSQGQMAIAESLSEKDREIARLRGDLEVAQNKIRQLQGDYENLYTRLDERLAKLEPQTVELDGQAVAVPPVESNTYQTGLDHFKAGNFSEAQASFEGFLSSFPNSKLSAQVVYFLGSCQFALGEYKNSLVTQRALIKDHPNSPRVPDAMLSIASSQLALKAIENAKKTLAELISKYPNSPAADSARERLAAIS